MTTHPALTTAPPTLVFVANQAELLRVSASYTSPELWAGEYVTLYDVADPQVLATYRVQRIQHRIGASSRQRARPPMPARRYPWPFPSPFFWPGGI
jgi:hypothetical protein